MLVVVPVNGFANRLRAVASAWTLSSTLKRKLCVYWPRSDDMDKFFVPAFDEIFLTNDAVPDSLFTNIAELPTDTKTYAGKHDGEQRFVPEIIRTPIDQTIILQSGGVFKPPKMTDKEYNKLKSTFYNSLRLRPEIHLIVKQFIETHFTNKRVLGVHVRRQDRKFETGPTNAFVDKISKLTNRFDIIFLCTDDKDEETRIRNTVRALPIVVHPKIDINRNTKEQFIDAVIDWYLLSNTDMILYSNGSSFGYEACFMKKLKCSIEVTQKSAHKSLDF